MKFRAVLQLHGKTATGIEVPTKVVQRLGDSKKPSVRVAIRGHSYRTTVAARGDAFFIPVSAANRTAAGVSAGQMLTVDVTLDDQPREVTVPADLTKALNHDAAAKSTFDRLSFSHKQAYVTWIEEAKKPETRDRRVAKTVGMLHQGKVR